LPAKTVDDLLWSSFGASVTEPAPNFSIFYFSGFLIRISRGAKRAPALKKE
jgi:hypothetical protein